MCLQLGKLLHVNRRYLSIHGLLEEGLQRAEGEVGIQLLSIQVPQVARILRRIISSDALGVQILRAPGLNIRTRICRSLQLRDLLLQLFL